MPKNRNRSNSNYRRLRPISRLKNRRRCKKYNRKRKEPPQRHKPNSINYKLRKKKLPPWNKKHLLKSKRRKLPKWNSFKLKQMRLKIRERMSKKCKRNWAKNKLVSEKKLKLCRQRKNNFRQEWLRNRLKLLQ